MLKICCPGCGVKLKIRPRMLGRKGRCPQCRQRLRVEPRGYVVRALIAAEPPESGHAQNEHRSVEMN